MAQQQVRKSRSEKADREDEGVSSAPQAHSETEAITQHSDELLDEIDSLLEQNAAQFVEGYVQRGGQ